jgi:hypothetical protein
MNKVEKIEKWQTRSIREKRSYDCEKIAQLISVRVNKLKETEIQKWALKLKREQIFKDVPLDTIKSQIRYYMDTRCK